MFDLAQDPNDLPRLDRALALGRLSLALLVAVVLRADGEPGLVRPGLLPFVFAYAAYAWLASVAIAVAGRRSHRLGVLLHWLDVAWVLPMTALTEGPHNVFLASYLFTLVSAAYRWGLRQTVATGILIGTALCAEAFAWRYGLGGQDALSLSQVATRCGHALGLGLLVGYLADEQHAARAHLAATARLLAAINTTAGLRTSVQSALEGFVRAFAARAATLALVEKDGASTFEWTVDAPGNPVTLIERPSATVRVPGPSTEGRARIVRIRRRGSSVRREGDGSSSDSADASALLPADAHTLIVGYVWFGGGWSGRLLLVDPRAHTGHRGRRWLASALPQAALALYNVYLLGRLRARATAMERSRIARELHDGVIQSLVGLAMRVDVLRRRLQDADPQGADELLDIQARLRDEALNVRELMNQVRPVAAGTDDLPALLASIADRFRRDCGIETHFVCALPRVRLAPQRVRELVRIAQEALVNIRKHSGARTVVLRLEQSTDACVLTIDDDGHGFDFAGRQTLDELDSLRRGPLVIKERVRLAGGTLVLDSAPGRGSRLEVSIPRSAA
jgi:signal transduction histidine kinase